MKESIAQSSVPVLTVDDMVGQLTSAYKAVFQAGLSPAAFPSVMLWGAPGVGKSQAVRQIGEKLEAATGKTCRVTDVRLLLFNPIDLRGIPVANEDRTLAVWLRPQIFQMDPSPEVINILFLDEISAAPPSVQAAAYQITLDRVVGEHRLPDNCIVIAAGNRVTDKSVAYKMPKALANRLMHIEIEGNFSSWRKWAVAHGINAKVLGYLSFRRDRLFGFDASNDDLAFATPRSWEMVSNILNTVSDDTMKVYSLIAGLVGTGAAMELHTWSKVFSKLPDIEGIFAGRWTSPPKSTDVLFALVSSMTVYAREHKSDRCALGNAISYAGMMPPEFTELFLSNLRAIEDGFEEELRQIPEYAKCIAKQGVNRNGYVN